MGCVWGKFVSLYGLIFRCTEEQAITQESENLENKHLIAETKKQKDGKIYPDDGDINNHDDETVDSGVLISESDIRSHESYADSNDMVGTEPQKYDELETQKCNEFGPEKCNECEPQENGVCEPYNRDEYDQNQANEVDVNDADDDFEDLLSKCPSNVILKILGYLEIKDLVHRVSLVSKSWHGMAFEPVLWSVLDLRKYVINDVVLNKLPQICNFINYILLPDDTNADFTDDGLIALATGCPNLRTFYAPRTGSKFSDAAFIAFAENCPRLKKLVFDCFDLTDKTLLSIAKNLHELEHLSVCQTSKITNEGVAEVIKHCTNLKVLLANQNKQITEKCLVTIPESSRSLRRLELLMCTIDHNEISVISQLKNLEDLNLCQCKDLTSDDLLPILEGCQKLRSIGLNLDKKVDDECIKVIFSHLSNLEHIYLVSTIITDEALFIMGQKGRKLRGIDVGYTKVTDIGARYVSENCPRLQYLDLIQCKQVPEEEIEKMVVEYPNIKYSSYMQNIKQLLRKIEMEEARANNH